MTKKRYEPNVGAVIFAPVVVSFTIAKQTLKRLHSVNEWLNANEPEVDQTVVNTLDAGLGLLSAGAKGTLVASSFAEGFVEAICENNNININAPRKEQVAGWKKTCKEWFKEEEKKEEKKTPASFSTTFEKGTVGEVSVKFPELFK